MIQKIEHIGIAVSDLDDVLKVYECLGLKPKHIETFGGVYNVRIAFIPVGESTLELLQPMKPLAGIIGEHIAKRGEGIHHVALKVDNIEETLAKLKEKGIQLIHNEPQKGSRGTKTAFIKAKSVRGTLIELVEHLNE
jgi:methylmalonyl-CoA/ethylmalonyl-CoA epimerase